MKKEKRILGFGRSSQEQKKRALEVFCEDELLRFNSGRHITFRDAVHHLVALGTTGSGKSASVIFPALLALLGMGAAGFVVDIKGNLRSKLGPIATAMGRSDDLVEFGTSPSAKRINILKDMSLHGIRQFIEELVMRYLKGSNNNSDWTMRGISQTADCGVLLLLLSEHDPAFEPTVRIILDMIESPAEAASLFKFFKEKVYDPENMEHRRFVKGVEGNEFHVLKKQTDNSSSRTTSGEQQTWNLNTSRDALRAFLATPGIEQNFCQQGAGGIDLFPYLNANKIITLRFELDTGPIGSYLARLVISHFYHLIFEIGTRHKHKRKFFICIDEFQEVADLSDGRFSDTSFIAMAREFNCAFIAATQSISALVCKGQQATAVEAFVSNCNQRIMFYSDDPATQEMAKRYDPDMRLSELESGQAFVVTYDQATRCHSHGVESLDDAYKSILDLGLEDLAPLAPSAVCGTDAQVSFYSILEHAKKYAANKLNSRPVQGNTGSREGFNMSATSINEIYENYERFFDPDVSADKFSIPSGWIASVADAFRIFSDIGLPVTISRFLFFNGHLKVTSKDGRGSSGSDMGIEILNSLLARSGRLCVICGASLDQPAQGEDGVSEDNDDNDDDAEEEFIIPMRSRSQKSEYFCCDCMKRIMTPSKTL